MVSSPSVVRIFFPGDNNDSLNFLDFYWNSYFFYSNSNMEIDMSVGGY